MTLHVFNDQKKFSKAFMSMLKDNNINIEATQLIHYGKKDIFFQNIGIKTIFIKNFFNPFINLRLFMPFYKADKIIVHSLASPYILLLLILFPKLGEKIYWVIWGKDLYFYHMINKPRFYHKFYEWMRKKAIRRIKNVISIFEEDYKLAEKWYGINANHIEAVSLYPYALDLEIFSNFNHFSEQADAQKRKDKNYIIILGNSASKTNNHIDALYKMKKCNKKIEKIICPLSYGGSKKYVNEVIAYGKKLYGKKFFPITEFMDKSDYFSLLQTVDIGVYNYSRQEGLGNIWSLMLGGKTIYMQTHTSTTSFFSRNNITVFDIKNLESGRIELLSDSAAKINADILFPLINVEASMKKWEKILC